MSVLKILVTIVAYSFLAITSLGVNFVMAQSETNESRPADNTIILPGLNRTATNQTRHSFTAAEYFYPIKPGALRDHLPERLTFEIDREIDLETLKVKLAAHLGKWFFTAVDKP